MCIRDSVQAAYNQLTKFGFQCTITSKSSATWDVDGGKGNYQIAGYWPSGGILKDFYSAISGFDGDLIKPLGETGSCLLYTSRDSKMSKQAS